MTSTLNVKGLQYTLFCREISFIPIYAHRGGGSRKVTKGREGHDIPQNWWRWHLNEQPLMDFTKSSKYIKSDRVLYTLRAWDRSSALKSRKCFAKSFKYIKSDREKYCFSRISTLRAWDRNSWNPGLLSLPNSVWEKHLNTNTNTNIRPQLFQ